MIDEENFTIEPLMPIWDAAVAGHWDIVKEWLWRDPSLINVTGEASVADWMSEYKDLSLFHLAVAWCSDVEVLKYLVSQGADVQKTRGSNKTSLHIAALHNSVEVLQYLISQDADVNAVEQHWNRSPLHYACEKNSWDVAQYLISQGADVHARDCEGYTPLHIAAMENTVEVLQCLVSQGADVHAKCAGNGTPLKHAAERNSVADDFLGGCLK